MFELHISCTKDIDKLQIDFSDGTSVIQTKPEKPEKSILSKSSKVSKYNNTLDLDSEYQNISHEVVEKPNIQDIKRPAKIAQELQNFNL